MQRLRKSVITGTGHLIPELKISNEHFLESSFYDINHQKLPKTNEEITRKFEEITTIAERRYVGCEMLTSDLAYLAARSAVESSKINPEELDYIIVAHNFGDIKPGTNRTDMVPSLAARVKKKLGIKNPGCIAYDMIFGCPGWLQALIQADYYLRSGDAHKALVIGADVLSRVSDEHDIDSMIYADGAGAVVLEAQELKENRGVLAHLTRSDALDYADLLYMDHSYNREAEEKNIYLKMHGRKLYQYALTFVPGAIKQCLENAGIHLSEVSKLFIHQANGKMDEAILSRLYKLYDMQAPENDIMPMSISWLGNSSVATIPTLLDLVLKGEIKNHQLEKDDVLVFASVGAGMNINAMVYRHVG
jgi:3-oxoacyl-[acyl-carrier-protein] synthase-3